MPFELRPEPTPTLKPEENYLQSTWERSVYPLADKFGITMHLPTVSPQPHTHLAFEGFQYAKEHGKGDAYNHAMFSAFFQKSENIGQIDILTRIAGEIALDTEQFKKALVSRKYKDAHQAALKHAYEEAAINVVPTFIIGKRRLEGLYSEDTLRRIIDEELKKQPIQLDEEGISCGIDGC